MIDFNRQKILDQDRIRNAKITVIGNTPISNFFCIYSSALGIGHIQVISEPNEEGIFHLSKNKSIEGNCRLINEATAVETVNSFCEELIGDTNIIIDTTNSVLSKKRSLNFIKKTNTYRISLSSSENSCSVSAFSAKKSLENILNNNHEINFCQKEYSSKKQGDFTSSLAAAIALDEVRKIVSPLKPEHGLKNKINYSLLSPKRFSFKSLKISTTKEDISKAKVLVVGAGGIGTHLTLSLALMGAGDIDIYDGDTIKTHNLNRQILFYNSVGKNKAKVLAERLKKINPEINVNAYDNYLDDKFIVTKPYDAIFCCVDNWKTRFVLENIAKKENIALINGAVTAFSSRVEYSKCMKCKYDLTEMIKTDGMGKKGCNNINNSNIIMANAFAGSLMAGELKAILFPEKYHGLYGKEIRYFTKNLDKRKFTTMNENQCWCKNAKNT